MKITLLIEVVGMCILTFAAIKYYLEFRRGPKDVLIGCEKALVGFRTLTPILPSGGMESPFATRTSTHSSITSTS